MKTLLSIGHGYCAQVLARDLVAQGWRVIATTRSPEKARALAQTGVEARVWPGQSLPVTVADGITHILTSVAPDSGQDPVLASLQADLRTCGATWIGYLSTVGVYGDHGGNWADESTPPTARSLRGQWRIQAEQDWRAVGAQVFRLAGIYGPPLMAPGPLVPGRGPVQKLQTGQARRIIKPGQVFSRIHVADIARCLMASMAAPHPGRIYNVCDDLPAAPQDVLAYAAGILNLPIPPDEDFATASLSPMARSFYADNRRVRNHRIKSELGVALLYPDYRTGIPACLPAA